jgi:hypothetical protein
MLGSGQQESGGGMTQQMAQQMPQTAPPSDLVGVGTGDLMEAEEGALANV